MDEAQLTEIENRVEQYPPQARYDILRLTRELRRLYADGPRKRSAHESSHLYDTLTGLLNGGAYGIRFAMARARATRYRKMFVVMSVDVSFPEASGRAGKLSDEDRELTIKHMAERLEGSVRATDTLARIGDENFAIILEDLSQPDHAERVKQIVQEALAGPVRMGARNIVPETSVRMQFYPDPRQGEARLSYN